MMCCLTPKNAECMTWLKVKAPKAGSLIWCSEDILTVKRSNRIKNRKYSPLSGHFNLPSNRFIMAEQRPSIMKERGFAAPVLERVVRMWKNVPFARGKEESCSWCKWAPECTAKSKETVKTARAWESSSKKDSAARTAREEKSQSQK